MVDPGTELLCRASPARNLQTLQGPPATLISRSVFPQFFVPSSYHWNDHQTSSRVRLRLHYLPVTFIVFQNINCKLVSMSPSNPYFQVGGKKQEYGGPPLTWPSNSCLLVFTSLCKSPFACGLDIVIRKYNVAEVLECDFQDSVIRRLALTLVVLSLALSWMAHRGAMS